MEACVKEYCAKLSKTGVKLLKEFIEETFLLDQTEEERFSYIKSKYAELLEDYPLPVIRFIDFDTFEKFGSCPRYPDNKEVTTPLSEIDRDNSLLVFISHCWMRGHRDAEGWDGRHHPDNASGDKFKLIVKGIRMLMRDSAKQMSHCYIWLDFGCVNQDKKSNLKDELERYDKIVECCDAIFTPIVDHEHEIWVFPKAFKSLFDSYKAKFWNYGPHAYLNRAWCRLEMLYAANIPVLDNSNGVKRHTMFEAGLAFQCSQNRRPHYLYGTKEYNKSGLQVLPPLQNKFLTRYHPSEGHLSVPEDIHHVKFLLNELQPYIDANKLDSGMYAGPRNNEGQRNGSGNFKGVDGSFYEGDFVNGVRSGKGKLILSNGDSYEGQFENDMMHGYGVYKYANGDVYEGELYHSEPHGHGVLNFASGNIYEGQFVNSKRSGKGLIRNVRGVFYSGDFVDDCFCGVGTLIFSNGAQYSGDFVDGMLNGRGILTESNGNIYEGDFVNDIKDGHGVMKFADGDVFEGNFKKGLTYCGKYVYKNGDTYEGDLIAGKCHGYGVYRFTNGEAYKGDYRHNQMHGIGIYSYMNGDIYEGPFQDDKREGIGIYRYVNGIVYEGDYHEGSPTRKGTYRCPNGDVFEVNNLHSTIKGLFKCSNGNVFTIHYDERNLWTYK